MSRLKYLILYIFFVCSLSTILLLAPHDHARAESSITPPIEDLVLSFDVDLYEIIGNKLIEEALIQRALIPHVGAAKSFVDLQAAVKAVQALYQNLGYSTVTVTLPPQNLAERHVKIQISEAEIGSVSVIGAKNYDEATILGYFPELKAGVVPNTKRITQKLGVLNRNANRQLAVVFRRGKVEHTVDVVIRVSEKSIHNWSLRLDNWGADNISPVRSIASYQNSNLTGNEDVLSTRLALLPAKLDRFASLGLSYAYPLYEQDANINVNASISYADSGRIADILDVGGEGYTVGASYLQHLDNGETYQHSASLGLSLRRYENSVQFLGVGPSLVPSLNEAPLKLSYQGRWTPSATTQISYSAGLAINLLGNKENYQGNRANADVHYAILDAAASYVRRLESDWYLRTQVAAQLTPNTLIPAAKMGVGGGSLIRALGQRELTSDSGIQASFDAYSPELFDGAWSGRLNAFVETALLNDNNGGGTGYLSDVGLGFTLSYRGRYSLQMSYARVLFGSDVVDDITGRFYLKFEAKF